MKHLLIILQCLFVFVANSFAGVRYTTANLNLRYGPGTKYAIVTTIPCGTAVTIDEDCDCKWMAVEYDGKIGYVSSKYLSATYYNSPDYSFHKLHSQSYTSKPRAISSIKYYTNRYGVRVQSPTHYSTIPAGATAICRDGTYSFSRSRRGTCSHHGGVAKWLN